MDKRKTYIMIVTPTATSSKKDLKIYKMCWDVLCANLKNNTDTFNVLLLHLFKKKLFGIRNFINLLIHFMKICAYLERSICVTISPV